MTQAVLQKRAEQLTAILISVFGLYFLAIRTIPFGYDIGAYANMALVAVGLVVFIFYLATHKDFLTSPYVTPFLIYVVLTAISALLAPSGYLGGNLKRSGMIFLSIMTLAAFYQTPKRDMPKKFTLILLPAAIGMIIVLLIGFLMFLVNFEYLVDYDGTEYVLGFIQTTYLRGVWFDPNFAAMYAGSWIALSFIALKMFKDRNGKIFDSAADKIVRFIYRVVFVLAIMFFPLANSRGSVVALFAALLVLGFIAHPDKTPLARKVKNPKLAYVVQALVFVAVGIGAYYAIQYAFEWYHAIRWQLISQTPNLPDFMDKFFNKRATYNSSDLSSGRFALWTQGLQEWTHEPIFGASSDAFPDLALKHGIGAPPVYGIASGYELHNAILEVLCFYGLAGIIPIFYIIFSFIYRTFKNGKAHGGDKSFLAATLAVGFLFTATCFLSSAWVTYNYTQWLLLIFFSYIVCVTSPHFKDEFVVEHKAALAEKDLVSVIVPVYNSKNTTTPTVESILQQTYSHLEIILVDDGSTDGSSELVDKLAQDDTTNRITVIHQENKGLSGARNSGIAQARGQWLVFVDADDILAPTFVATLLIAAKMANTQIARCGCITSKNPTPEMFEEHDKIYAVTHSWIEECYLQFTQSAAITAWGKIYDKDLFETIRFPEGKLHEDEYTTPLLVKKAGEVAVCEADLYGYRVDPDSTSITSVYKPSRFDAAHAFLGRAEIFAHAKEPSLETRALWSAYLIALYHKVHARGYLTELDTDAASQKLLQNSSDKFAAQKTEAETVLDEASKLSDELYTKLEHDKNLGLQRKVRLKASHAFPENYFKLFK